MTAFPPSVRRTVTHSGTRIYTLEVDAYRSLPVNVFVILRGPVSQPTYRALVDTGSERPACFQQILGGLDHLHSTYGEQVGLEALDRIILTHEHPDHIGGLPLLQRHTRAPLAAHPLAAESLRDPLDAQQRSLSVQQEVYRWVGLPEEMSAAWLATQKRPVIPAGVTVATELSPQELLDGFIQVIHVPGHAAGQVALGIDEVLLTADHLLPGNLPPLWPERLRPFLGLSHYLHSLRAVEQRPGIRQVLPSHGLPIDRADQRVEAVRQKVVGKLERVIEQVGTAPGRTIFEIAQVLYPDQPAPRARLLLSQTAALVEYLAERNVLTEARGKQGAATWTLGEQTAELGV